MKPILFRFDAGPLGEISFPAYFTLLTVGFCFTIYLARRDAERVGIDPIRAVDLHLFIIVWGMIGSRLLHVIADGHFWDYVNLCVDPAKVQLPGTPTTSCVTDAQCGPGYVCATALAKCHPPRDCLAWAKLWRGGLTYYGGFIAASAYALYSLWRHRLPLWKVADIAGRLIPLGLVWGRLGCYFNGCCFGAPLDGPLGARFPRGSAIWRAQVDAHLISRSDHALPVHATQLYESAACLGIYAFLVFYLKPRQRFDGQAFWSFVCLYALARFSIEVLRRDERGEILGLSTSQLISLPLLGAGLFMLYWLGSRAQAQPAGPTPG